jgi:hypothetical protein
MTFDLTGIDIESVKKELPLKKKELDSKFDVDPQKSSIRMMIVQLDRLDPYINVKPSTRGSY